MVCEEAVNPLQHRKDLFFSEEVYSSLISILRNERIPFTGRGINFGGKATPEASRSSLVVSMAVRKYFEQI